MAENFVNIIRDIRGSTNEPATDTSCIYGDIKSMHKEYQGFKQITDEERSKLENIEEGATKNSTDRFLLSRENHTGNISIANVQDTPSRMAMTIYQKNKLDAINVDATKNDTDANLRNRATHSGTQSIDTITDTSTHVKMSVAERDKLATVATGATKNATDAELRSRSTHTGTQSADSIVDGLVNAAYTIQEKNKLSVLSTTVPPAHTHDNTSIINLSYSKLTNVPETFYPSKHLHSMDEITTGNLDAARINQTNSMQFVNSIEKEKIANAESMNNKGVAFGYAPLDGDGKINQSYLGSLNVVDVFTPINNEAMLLLTSAKPGDIAYVQDSESTYMLVAMPAHLQDNWKKVTTGSGVITFNGLSGVVNVGTDNIPEGSANIYFTNERVDDRVANLLTPGENVSIVYNDDTNQIIISANDTSVEWSEIQNKPNTKIDVNLSGEISGSGSVILSQLGDGTLNIENITSDTYEPKNSNIQGHIINYANPHNVTPAQIGLGNVNNTSDLDKPLSNPTKAYIDSLISSPVVINKPVIVTPVNLTIDFLGSIVSTYSPSSNYEGLQSKVIWECALDDSFNDIIDRYEGSDNLTSWVPNIGLALTTVYVRTRQISDGHLSEWSDSVCFTTPDMYIVAPTLDVAGAPNSVTLTPLLTGSAFNVYNGTDTHASSDWQAARLSDGEIVWESLNDTQNLLSITTDTLPIGTDLIFRVRYNGAAYGSSAWREVVASTLDIHVAKPTLTVAGYPSSVTLTPLLTGSPFNVVNGTDTHVSTDWRAVKFHDGSTVWESLEDTVNLTSINTAQLPKNTKLVFMVRYNSSVYGSSEWTEVTAQTLNVYVQDPVLTAAGYPNSLTLSPALSASAFVIVNGTADHVSSDWEIRKVSDNSVAWSSIGDTVNKTSITANGLDLLTQYKIRVKYNSNLYGSSNWIEVTGTTLNIYVNNPTLTIEGTPDDVSKNPTISGSAFSVYNGTDTHESTDYQAVRVSDGVIVWESLGNTVDKTSIQTGDLVESTAYIFKMRYKSTSYGYSQWVQTTGTTKATFFIHTIIGIQGEKGFGVAPTTEPFAVLGLAVMDGTNDKESNNYGNYIHSNGSIVCWCPKSYYRVGSSKSPRFAKYGDNALDIVGSEIFSTTAEANAAGYVLPRVFINAGKEQSGFFIDKYMNSKDGTTKSKSIFGGVPISLTSDAGYTASNGMTGCTGIFADAVVLSIARGTRWNTATAFMYGYLAMVSVAQAQSATSTADVAWYDPAGVTNFPKGCNNNSLSDVNDTSVVYATSGDASASKKPKTGATQGFAKTTHNGSANGVADLNGGMNEVTIGITNFGTSATDNTAVSTDEIYVLKHSVDVATLTGGWNGTNDVWGDATNLGKKYDLVTSPHPIGSSTGKVYCGNGSNAVLQNDLSGVNRDICGFIPKNSSSTSATGVNLFGNDELSKGSERNMVPLTCGYSSFAGAGGGVFYRTFGFRRSSAYYHTSFRASAYFA